MKKLLLIPILLSALGASAQVVCVNQSLSTVKASCYSCDWNEAEASGTTFLFTKSSDVDVVYMFPSGTHANSTLMYKYHNDAAYQKALLAISNDSDYKVIDTRKWSYESSCEDKCYVFVVEDDGGTHSIMYTVFPDVE